MSASEQGAVLAYNDVYFTSYAGIKIYGRHYPGDPSKRPLICLSNIIENGRTFEPLCYALSHEQHTMRPVYTIDYRGRGYSEHDPNWNNYAPLIEMIDLINFMTLNRIHQPIILGSGWGGIIAMMIATFHPTMLGPIILNDIGPRIETNGLIRAQAFIGRLPIPTSWRKAAELLKDLHGNHFTDLSDDVWMRLAHEQFNEENDRPTLSYDRNLQKSMMMLDVIEGAPLMWEQFLAMKHLPILAIRGENSDVLSKETFEEMFYRHPNLQMFTVANEGHTPLLDDDLSIERIRLFLDRCDMTEEEFQAQQTA